MLETVVVTAIVLGAFALVFRSFYRSFTGKEDEGYYGGTCSDACRNCRRDCCQQKPYSENPTPGSGPRELSHHGR